MDAFHENLLDDRGSLKVSRPSSRHVTAPVVRSVLHLAINPAVQSRVVLNLARSTLGRPTSTREGDQSLHHSQIPAENQNVASIHLGMQ